MLSTRVFRRTLGPVLLLVLATLFGAGPALAQGQARSATGCVFKVHEPHVLGVPAAVEPRLPRLDDTPPPAALPDCRRRR